MVACRTAAKSAIFTIVGRSDVFSSFNPAYGPTYDKYMDVLRGLLKTFGGRVLTADKLLGSWKIADSLGHIHNDSREDYLAFLHESYSKVEPTSQFKVLLLREDWVADAPSSSKRKEMEVLPMPIEDTELDTDLARVDFQFVQTERPMTPCISRVLEQTVPQRAIRDSVEGFLSMLAVDLNLTRMSIMDFANEFETPSEISKRTASLQQSTQQAINKVWRRASKINEQTIRERTKRVLDGDSTVHIPRQTGSSEDSSVVPASQKVRIFERGVYRSVPAAPVLPRTLPGRALYVDPSKTSVHTDVKELNKAKQLANFLWSIFILLGHFGIRYAEYDDLSDKLKKQHENMWFENVTNKPVTTLAGAVGRWTSWVGWAQEQLCPVYDIKPIHVRLYLRSLLSKGATAAKGAYRQLRWLERTVGCFFHTDDPDVKAQAAVHGDHIEKQVAPMKLVWWVKLECLVSSSNEFVSAICMTWCLIITCVLRFAHVQRSHIKALTDRSYEVFCARDKVKTQGACRPFYARGPRLGVTGLDLGSYLMKFQKRKTDDVQLAGMYFLPDFGPDRAGLNQVNAMRTVKMSQPKFIRYSQQLFDAEKMDVPSSVIVAALKSTYKGRRILPTACNQIGMSTKEALSVGGWRDSDGSMVKEARRLSMPTRYADQELESSALLKQEIVTSCRVAWNRITSTLQDALASHSPPSSSEYEKYDWHEVRSFLPSRKQSKTLMLEEALNRAGGDADYVPQGRQLVSFHNPKEVRDSTGNEVSSLNLSGKKIWSGDTKRVPYPFEGDSSFMSHFGNYDDALEAWHKSTRQDPSKRYEAQSSSSSDSDNADDTDSDSSVDLDKTEKTRIAAEQGPEHVQWLLPLSAKSVLHVKSMDRDGYYCECHRTLTRAEEGIGIEVAFSTGRRWSPRCFRYLIKQGLDGAWKKCLNDNPGWLSDDEEPVKDTPSQSSGSKEGLSEAMRAIIAPGPAQTRAAKADAEAESESYPIVD